MESSTCGSIKRTRTPNSGCLVDGCNSDLSKCRDYHRRHKVCELHSKSPKVAIKGREQRFCQQCSRFHSLEEFDEGKRSCRKRLDWHNRRRRKPQPEPMAVNSTTFLSSYQGGRVSAFDRPQILAATGPVVSSGRMKSENNIVFFNGRSQLDGRNMSITESFCEKEKGEGQFSFLQGVNGGGSSSHKLLFDNLKLNRDVDIDSECALSLLSWTPSENEDFGWRHVMHPNPNGNPPPPPPFGSGIGREIGRESTPVVDDTQGLSSTINVDVTSNANLHFHIGSPSTNSFGHGNSCWTTQFNDTYT